MIVDRSKRVSSRLKRKNSRTKDFPSFRENRISLTKSFPGIIVWALREYPFLTWKEIKQELDWTVKLNIVFVITEINHDLDLRKNYLEKKGFIDFLHQV